MTDLHLRISIFEVIMDFNAPLMCGFNKINVPSVYLKIGDILVSIENRIYIPDDQVKARKNKTPHDNMSQAIFNLKFVEVNPKIFKKL